MSYTDLVSTGDRLQAIGRIYDKYEMGLSFSERIATYVVKNRDEAVCVANGKTYKLNRRGNDAALFVGNSKVLGRV